VEAVSLSQPADFREFLARQAEAEEAIVYGDAEPRMRLWSRRDPVSLLGAWGPNKSGWDELSAIFRWVASRLSHATYRNFRWDIEVADARGDMGYTVGLERFNHYTEDGRVEPITVRVTHVYRREDGEWRIVHRHGDLAPIDESPAPEPSSD
jgi:ketosteroid isomerase-like protein